MRLLCLGKKLQWLIGAGLLLSALMGCGIKGPLYLPHEKGSASAPATDDAAATSAGAEAPSTPPANQEDTK